VLCAICNMYFSVLSCSTAVRNNPVVRESRTSETRTRNSCNHMGTKRPKSGHIRALVLYMCACTIVQGRMMHYTLFRCWGIHFWTQKWHWTSRTHRKLHCKMVKIELYTRIGARALGRTTCAEARLLGRFRSQILNKLFTFSLF
jgi:hypothetical protein